MIKSVGINKHCCNEKVESYTRTWLICLVPALRGVLPTQLNDRKRKQKLQEFDKQVVDLFDQQTVIMARRKGEWSPTFQVIKPFLEDICSACCIPAAVYLSMDRDQQLLSKRKLVNKQIYPTKCSEHTILPEVYKLLHPYEIIFSQSKRII